MEHVNTRRRLAVLDAGAAGQLHADAREQRQPRDLVPHPEQSCVEVDLGGERGDGDQARVPNEQEGRDRLLLAKIRAGGVSLQASTHIEKARVHVGRLLEHDEVPTRPLGGRDLPVAAEWSIKKRILETRGRTGPDLGWARVYKNSGDPGAIRAQQTWATSSVVSVRGSSFRRW